jgi:molybdenum cofactor cytidylyltransferase
VTSDPDAELIESIRMGLTAAVEADAQADVLLQLADHPEVAPQTIRAMIAAQVAHPHRAVIPQYQGRGGHPVLIPPGLAAELITVALIGGLRDYWLRHPDKCYRVPVDDPAVIHDIDTPDQVQM